MTSADSPSPKSPKKKKEKRPGRWRRRTIWALSILIVLGFVLRATLPLALPAVLRKIAGNFGMTCNYDRLELNLFSGDAGMWGLEFKPREGGPAIFAADYCHGNISVLNLFRGKLNVWRVEADGVDVNIDRNPDGHIPLLDRFVSATATTPATPATTPAKGKPGELDLSSPVRVDALRLDHIRVHIHDRGITPELDTELAMDLRLSDLGSLARPARFEMNLSADPMLDTMRITGEGTSAGKNLDAKFSALVRGIRLKPAAAYLAPFGIRPVSDSITLRAEGHIHTAPAPNNAEGFTASLAFGRLSATADRSEALALDRLAIDGGVIDTKSIRIDRCIAVGARVTAGRAADGNLQIAGIEYDPAIAAHAPPSPPAPSSSPSPLLVELMAEHWSVGELSLKDARADFHDQCITPSVDLSLIADELSAMSIDHDPRNLNTSVTLVGRVRAPGLIHDIKLEGNATPFADQKKFAVTVNATGIKPDAIKPYLDQIGLKSTLKDAQFTLAANADLTIGDTITADAKVTKFDFRDEVPLFSLTDVTISNAVLDPQTKAISVDDIELTGPQISAVRDSTSQFAALGFRTKPRSPAAKSPAAATKNVATTAPAAQPFKLASLPRVTLKKFGWQGVRFDLEDQAVIPVSNISFPSVGITAENLTTDFRAKSPGRFKLWLSSPQLVDAFQVDGEVTPLSDGVKVLANINGSGLNATPLAAYLKPFGVEPVLKYGGLTGSGTATLQITASGPTASLSLNPVKYTDGFAVMAGLDGMEANDLSFAGDTIVVKRIYIDHPHASVRRDADGSLLAGGFRLLPASNSKQDAVVSTPVAVAAKSATAPSAESATPLVLRLPQVNVTDATIDWKDLAVEPNVATSAKVTVQIRDLVLGKEAPPADLRMLASVDGAVDEITVAGPVTVSPSGQSAKLDIWLNGLHPSPLRGYFPAGIDSSLKAGRLHAGLAVNVSPDKSGGIAADLKVGPVDFTDDDPMFRLDHPLFHLDEALVSIPSIDLPDTALEVKEISVKGLRTHAEKLPGGELACMGLLIGGKTEEPVKPVVFPTTTPAVAVAPSVADLLAASHRVLPAVTVEKLDLNVEKLTLSDLSRKDSAPLVISDLRLHNVDRIDWLGKDAERNPPTKLQFSCRVAPLVDQVLVDVTATPFHRQPYLHVDFAATGVHGDGLTELVPELQQQVDGTAMTDGSLSAHLNVDAKLDRRSPIDFDVSRGFDLSLVLDKVQYRAKPEGPVLAGVDEVRSEGIRIAPRDSTMYFKTLEITNPIGLVTRDVAGIHALGWTYKIPGVTTQPVVVAKTNQVGSGDEKPGSSESLKDRRQQAKPAGEIRIDKLLISGLDFRIEDSAVTPPLVIPLNGLDMEVKNLSSLAPYEDIPIRFSAVVNAGKVRLAKHGSNPPVLEDRDLFSQITANGEVSLYPRLHGWAKSSVSSLDLAALQGAAAQFNETLTAGLYDSEVDLRFDPGGAIVINSRFSLTDLSLSEPPNGLIFRVLHLPAPLDVCIAAVQGADGSITLPVDLSLDPNHISYLDIGGAAAAGVASVIGTAVAAAPLKAANDMSGLIGLGGSDVPKDLTTHVPFAPGSAACGAEQTAAMSALLKQLHDDDSLTVMLRQQLGGGDVEIARIRANPTREQSESLESQLRLHKAELLQLRADAAGRARAELVSLGADAAKPSLDHLRAIDREIADVDESLDQMGELLKPGADRLAQRRTRAAALQIARDRLEAIQSTFISAGISADRVKLLSAQFNPADEMKGGEVVVLVVKKK